jgi:5-formyltetrahydrofolate cyclo-ligase
VVDSLTTHGYGRAMDATLAQLKEQARKDATRRRRAAHAAAGETAPLRLAAQAFPVSPQPGAGVVSAFFPYQSEIDARPLLGRLAGQGWTTCLPVVMGQGQPLVFRRWMPGEPTIPGIWNIPRPTEQAEVVEPDVLMVPLLAFDRQGYRLGYGGGFYDRTLELLRKKKTVTAIGVAYAGQEMASVPRGTHDQRLDFVMTEQGCFACG